MSLKPYKDMGKSAKDLLEKDYPSGLDVTVKTASGTNCVRSLESKVSVSGNKVKASVAPKFKIAEYGAEVSGSVDNAKELKLDVTVADRPAKGLKLKLKTKAPQFDARDRLSVRTEVEYASAQVAASLGGDVVQGGAVDAAATFAATPDVTVGVTGSYPLLGGGDDAAA
eukprot:CAMPEP_0198336562 /NCGR_PEP_ID=MMETSP1450-20131203/21061_1 /TAXON_ID=753684 ORGANISM="Madagascaria erythrocladiodes, Strain CCMP3234" /NCGR_SAMPLE_ID=MMETSP1450 /ASSEMBLY_ACC=CAM_ASM_001115 /LENGTH=168 /DNA_ID=CAMNT_0044041311 /DNA_START=116 /DNA_END=618 /DNA_ORIENTATION=+